MDKELLINKMVDLLREYDHYASYNGCKKIVDEWERNKSFLMDKFRHHPNWDEDNARIVFSNDYTREFEKNALYDYVNTAKNIMVDTLIYPNVVKIEGLTYQQARSNWEKMRDINENIYYVKRDLNLGENAVIGDKTIAEWKLKLHEARNIKNAFDCNRQFCQWDQYTYLPKDIFDRANKLAAFNSLLTSSYVDSHIISEELMGRVREIYPDIKTGAGTKLSKLLRKVMAMYPEMLAWTDHEHSSWYDDNGQYHERDREITYDTILTRLADKISPLHIQRHTVISFNPLDYLTMSFGANWASCHTIDKDNRRGVNNQGFHGEYCSGTLSYMLDNTSIIFYTVDKEYEGTEFETQNKQNRVMFHLHNSGDLMIQGRVYPDGRDGGDNSLAKQFREVMQKIVSEVFNKDNHWVVEKGTLANATESCGTNYEDYIHYSDCSASRRVGCDTVNMIVSIGHMPIDPDTGYEHEETEYLNADGGMCSPRICYHCDERFDYDEEGYYCADTGEYYCCSSCAEADGLIWCSNDDEFHDEDHCFFDSYRSEYRSGEPEVETEDGRYYEDRFEAEEAGYRETGDGYWYPEEDLFFDNYEDEWYHIDDIEVDIDYEHRYRSEDNAESDGCIHVDDTWYADEDDARESGCICTYDTEEWYANEDDAKSDGCIYVADEGEWYSSKEEVEKLGYEFVDGEWRAA